MKNTVVIHHHLGLGDHIICNGLINQMSVSKKIYLICKLQYYKNIKYETYDKVCPSIKTTTMSK